MLAASLPAWSAEAPCRATTEVDFPRGRGERLTVIASVAFRKFKALRETSLTLLPFNLVIGPNGSGKTSLIQALLRLRTLSKLPLAEGERRTDGPEIEFRFFSPYDSVQARLGCRSELVCDLLQVIPADAPDWPTLRERVGHIRSYFFDHYAMAEPSTAKTGAELSSNGGNLAAALAGCKLSSYFTQDLIAEAAILAVFALSLDFLATCGLVSFGHAGLLLRYRSGRVQGAHDPRADGDALGL